MSFIDQYITDAIQILKTLDKSQIDKMIEILVSLRQKRGRLFFIGVGGSAANCSHAVNDFRKLVGIESYSPVDNVAELTARTNDEGWETVFSTWLETSNLNVNDAVFVLSVGGGSKEKNISVNLVQALKYAKLQKAKILGIVGRDGGYTRQVADACLLIPTINPNTITPHAEAFQAVIWHLMAADPRLARIKNKWESVTIGHSV